MANKKKSEYKRLEVYHPQTGWVVMCDNTSYKDGVIEHNDTEVVWTYTHPGAGKVRMVVDLFHFGAYSLA